MRLALKVLALRVVILALKGAVRLVAVLAFVTKCLARLIDVLLLSTLPIGSVMRVPVAVSSGLVLLAVMLAITSPTTLAWMAIAFPSGLVHELGHAWAARRYGASVGGLRLDIVGGMVFIDFPENADVELAIAIAGPLTSIVIAIVVFAVRDVIVPLEVLSQVGSVNLVLALFNLVPGFPMDGGRILRALLVRRLGRLRATIMAVRVSRGLCCAFAVLGLVGAPQLVIIAVMLWFGGTAELSRVKRLSEA